MPRYKNISEAQLGPDKLVKIVNAHSNGTTITFEGPVVEVVTEDVPQGTLLPDRAARVIFRPVAVKFIGDITAAIAAKKGWSCTHIYEVLPDLPTTPGSVVVIGGRAAVLAQQGMSFDELIFDWVWAHDTDTQVPAAELNEATVLHHG